MQVKISEAIEMITAFIKAGIVPMIHGSPGIGKSQIIYQIAKEYGLKVIDKRLSQCDPTDLSGFPSINEARNKASYVPMDEFPLEGDPIPAGYNGWILFFDEINSAPKAVQAASYKILLDLMIGQHKLHKKCAIVAAGNLETDGAIVEEMSTALQSRLAHINLVPDAEEFTNWATKAGMDHRIGDYIKFKPGQLFTFQADHTDNTYACPRTWEFANRVLKVTQEGSDTRLAMLAGTLSEGVAREFLTFCKIYESLPKSGEIMSNPEGIKVPTEPSILFALTGSIAHNANKDTLDALMKFIFRLPSEFQVITMREIIRRDSKLMAHNATAKWLDVSKSKLF